MAYLRTDRILMRLKEIVEDGLAQYRTITDGYYIGDLPTGLSTSADLRRATEGARIHVNMPGLTRAAESPPTNGSLLIYDIAIEIRIIRLLDRGTQLTPNDQYLVQALAGQDADVLRQAIEYSRNTRFLANGDPTGVIGLLWTNTSAQVRGLIDEGAQTIETIHRFSGKAVTTPEVDVSLEVENPQDSPDIGISIDTEEIVP